VPYRGVLFDLFGTLIGFDVTRLPELETSGQCLRTTVGGLRELLAEWVPGTPPDEFLHALLTVSDEMARARAVDHVELPALSTAARWDEITRSKRALERHLGHLEYWFAYPAGVFDGRSQADLRRAGYLLSYTTQYGATISSTSPEAEPRVRVHGQGTVADFAATVTAATGRP